MKHALSFVLGTALGVCGTLWVVQLGTPEAAGHPARPGTALALSAAPATPAAERGADPGLPPGGPALQPPAAPAAAPAAAAPAALVSTLLHQLAADPDAPFNSAASRSLACWMQQDPQVARQVRHRLLSSPSATERHSLVRLLAHDNSPETALLVGQLLSGPEGPAKRLGYELLRSLDPSSARPELTRTLLAAAQQETHPEHLADLIASLSVQPLDEGDKGVLVQQLQALLADSRQATRASALMGLAQLADPPTLALAVKRHLADPEPAVRLAAVNAALRLQARQLDTEVLGSAQRLSQSPEEPEAVRQLAAALLERQRPPAGP